MAQKSKSVFVCSQCGYESPKWYGKCPGCGEWNSMSEEMRAPVSASGPKSASGGRGAPRVVQINEISADAEHRYATGLKELDRVLGGGAVKGSLVLVGGAPGIGKSTLML